MLGWASRGNDGSASMRMPVTVARPPPGKRIGTVTPQVSRVSRR